MFQRERRVEIKRGCIPCPTKKEEWTRETLYFLSKRKNENKLERRLYYTSKGRKESELEKRLYSLYQGERRAN